MNIPMSWLKDYVDIASLDIRKFMEDLTMSGTVAEVVNHIGKDIKGVVVGKVLSIEKHPDADKLVVTQIDVGGKTVQIVTGATNVSVGCFVPVALDGAVLHGDLKIKNSKLRGVESQGMLCSIEELGYTRADYPEAPEDGIYLFAEEQELGSCALEILEIREDVVEFELTSNRPDCYSVVGVAREVAATYDKPLKLPEINILEQAEGNINELIDVEIENTKACPRYIARIVKNVKVGPSPQWLRHRLTTSGIKPINNIVDITNYVMLEFGQPIHAFDYNAIEDKKIIVRNAFENEKITTLDGIERELTESMLVIADSKKALAIAGVMGGEGSKVCENTTTILFESANFNGTNVRVTSKKLGLRTDASSKYEKGLDPNVAIMSVNRCVQLVEMLGIGEVVKGMVDCYPATRNSWEVAYSPERINKLLGTDISKEEMVTFLKRLQIESDGTVAKIPTFRADIQAEADLAEEIARIYGYNNIKSTLAAGTATVGKKTYSQTIEDKIKNTMISVGFSESLHFSFESPKVFDKLNYDKECNFKNAVVISNPLGEDFSIMRTTTLNGILNSLSTNYNRRNEEACLFEVG
ncbi:MAG: phenylalanine--tRNA ligase subunit beta, partial [Defluviitaleaceae bacterium]|nr:phenylalanine--tRNA ligase subunit beta [Defluviitaleaceae bacterium]